jgi:tetratricopeptide (TPR) repeat protein
MENTQIKIREKKFILVALAFAIISFLVYIASVGYQYSQIKDLTQEGKQLETAGKYKDAIDKLTLAQSMWSPFINGNGIATEIKADKQFIADQLTASNDNYNMGKTQYDTGNYAMAIEFFGKVIKSDINNYQTAQNYVELAQQKIDEAQVNSLKPFAETRLSNDQEARSVTATPPLTPTIDCIGADGKHLQVTQQECDSFNASWGDYRSYCTRFNCSCIPEANNIYSCLTPTPIPSQIPNSSQTVICNVGGKTYQLSQADCNSALLLELALLQSPVSVNHSDIKAYDNCMSEAVNSVTQKATGVILNPTQQSNLIALAEKNCTFYLH